MNNILKIISILLLTMAMGCKKKDPRPEIFDLTKYSIVGKLNTGYPYLITIAGDKAVFTHYSATNGKYSFVDGVLRLNFNEEVICSFVIENGAIKSYTGPAIINTYDLVKIPATNQLDGKTFKGSWNNAVYVTRLKFTGGQYVEITNNQQTTTNYTLINNLAVKKEEAGNLTLFILMNGKLEAGRYKYPNIFWGSFISD